MSKSLKPTILISIRLGGKRSKKFKTTYDKYDNLYS